MKNRENIYSFYFSFVGNMRLPTSVARILIGFNILAIILIFVFGSIIGTIMLLASPILFFLFKEHLMIDIEQKKYRYAIDFCGFNMGPWKELPNIEYVSVFVAKYRSGSQGGDDSKGFRKLEVNLIHSRNKRLNVWIGNDKDDAFEAAKYLSKNLNIRLLDATQKPFEWLD
jgi:hypothetical protein